MIIYAIRILNSFIFTRQKSLKLSEDDKDDVGKESDDLEYGYQNCYMYVIKTF